MADTLTIGGDVGKTVAAYVGMQMLAGAVKAVQAVRRLKRVARNMLNPLNADEGHKMAAEIARETTEKYPGYFTDEEVRGPDNRMFLHRLGWHAQVEIEGEGKGGDGHGHGHGTEGSEDAQTELDWNRTLRARVGGETGVDGTSRRTDDGPHPADVCRIDVNVDGPNKRQYVQGTIQHEMFHCWQEQMLDDDQRRNLIAHIGAEVPLRTLATEWFGEKTYKGLDEATKRMVQGTEDDNTGLSPAYVESMQNADRKDRHSVGWGNEEYYKDKHQVDYEGSLHAHPETNEIHLNHADLLKPENAGMAMIIEEAAAGLTSSRLAPEGTATLPTHGTDGAEQMTAWIQSMTQDAMAVYGGHISVEEFQARYAHLIDSGPDTSPATIGAPVPTSVVAWMRSAGGEPQHGVMNTRINADEAEQPGVRNGSHKGVLNTRINADTPQVPEHNHRGRHHRSAVARSAKGGTHSPPHSGTHGNRGPPNTKMGIEKALATTRVAKQTTITALGENKAATERADATHTVSRAWEATRNAGARSGIIALQAGVTTASLTMKMVGRASAAGMANIDQGPAMKGATIGTHTSKLASERASEGKGNGLGREAPERAISPMAKAAAQFTPPVKQSPGHEPARVHAPTLSHDRGMER